MRIDQPVLKTTILTFFQDNGVTRDSRAMSIVEASKEDIVNLIKELFSENFEKKKGERLNRSVKLTVQIIDRTEDRQTKDEFSYRLYRCDVNAIELIINHIKNNSNEKN